jgi:hypothetical protein
MVVELWPDGATLDLEVPSRAALLSGDGSMIGVARTAWSDRTMDIESARTDAVFAAATWALAAFAHSPDGMDFAQQCLFWKTTPAREIGLDGLLADTLNRASRDALLVAAQAMAGEEAPTTFNSPTRGAVNGSPEDAQAEA